MTGDPALLGIVRLSLIVSLSAVAFALLIAVPFGAFVALNRFPGREAVIVLMNALMGLPPVVAGACGIPPAFAFRTAWPAWAAFHADGDDHRTGNFGNTHHRGAHAPDN